MKKIIAAVLVLICILGLVGCTNNSDPNPFDADADEKTAFLRIGQQGELYDGQTTEAVKLMIQFKSTEGPSEITVEVWHRLNDGEFILSGESVSVKVGETASFAVPSNSDYIVKTTATSGNDSNVIFLVSQDS